MIIKKNKKINKVIVIIVTLVILAGVVAAIFILKSRLEPSSNNTSPTAQSRPYTVDDSPATQEDQQAADDKKQQNLDRDTQSSPAGTATVVITYAGYDNGALQVSSIVTSPYESGGRCTYTLTNGSSTITRTVDADQDARSVVCDGISMPRSDLVAGTYTIGVSYSSSSSTGQSATQKVNVE